MNDGIPLRTVSGARRAPRAFTLIELLIVISIIAILASMIFPITKAVNRSKLRSRARAELAQIQVVVDAYKSKLGTYPPDNPGNPVLNQLYYELVGTARTTTNGVQYWTLDGSANISAAALPAVLGPRVTGLVNTARASGGDEASAGINFFKGLRPNQVGSLPMAGGSTPKVLVCSVPWPQEIPYQPIPVAKGLNPWRYVSSNPTNNPNAYDLWVDIMVDGKTNRISNWSREPLINP